ncbi:MAG: ankyrin repeat domain-containing protein [Rickettsiaceae bacterium]|nr:ankyrin repeat domain-containing protein [Rickettsiaceae bacterium]
MGGHTETAALLIDKGANVNAQDVDNQTALIYAATWSRTETATLLIEMGADVNAQDRYNETALICAAQRGHTETAALLIYKGADAQEITRSLFSRCSIQNLNKLRDWLLNQGNIDEIQNIRSPYAKGIATIISCAPNLDFEQIKSDCAQHNQSHQLHEIIKQCEAFHTNLHHSGPPILK